MKPVAVLILSALYIGQSIPAHAAPDNAKLAYNMATEKAANDYKLARARCDVLTGNPKDICIVEAKAARIYLEANASARFKNSLAATTDARKAIAEADYDVEKTRCASLTGNPKDVCLKESKANLVAALADAKADRKIAEARADAQEDKRSADYKVALEKCDAYAGAPQKACVADVKTQFGN